MADELLNGREATDFVAGLIAEYPRADSPASRPLTTVAELS